MTIRENRRQLFEIWWKAEGRHRKHQGIIAGDEDIGFELWCAALDSVVIELPSTRMTLASCEYVRGIREYGDAVRSAIESNGLGLKVMP